MKMKTKNLPAILLAVVAAMILMLSAAGTVYADNGDYDVEISPMFGGEYIALPGGRIPLSAEVYQDFEGDLVRDDGDLDFKWELDEEDAQFATIRPHKYASSIATVKFKELPEGQTEIDAIVRATVTVLSNDEEVATASVYLLESSDYYVVYPTTMDSFLGVGKEVTVDAEVRHYTVGNFAGDIVKDVNFDWYVEGGDIKITPVSRSEDGAVYNLKRLTAEDSLLMLEATWGEGDDAHTEYSVLWTDEIPTDLNEYRVSLPYDLAGAYEYFVDEGEVIDRAYLEENTAVSYEKKDNVVYLERGTDYDLVVEKYKGYNYDTGESYWEPYEGDLKTDPKGSAPDMNGEPTEGTGIYKITAKGKGDLTGETIDYAQYIYMYSKKSVSGYAPNFSFDYSYATYLDDEPWFRYDVKPGTTLDPTVTLNEEELVEGAEYDTIYMGINVDYEAKNKFPTEPGEYVAYIEGIGDYYGTSYMRYIKVGKTNYDFRASAKTIKAKAKKKTTFTAKKAFKVSDNKGEVTYEKVSGNKKIKVSSTGKVTVNKGLKKGKTYKVKVKITDNDSDEYFATSKTVTLKVKVTK